MSIIKYFRCISHAIMAMILCTGCASGDQEASEGLTILQAENYSNTEGDSNSEDKGDSEISNNLDNTDGSEKSQVETPKNRKEVSMFSVYVCGAVKNPDVYELVEGSRIYEAIERAGGVTGEAEESYLNLAQVIEDGQKIYVPTKEEVDEEAGSWIEAGSGESTEGSKVNINTATKSELMTLPGIGESKADSIIEYREDIGVFSCPEDIQNITGIKAGVYDKIEDQITV